MLLSYLYSEGSTLDLKIENYDNSKITFIVNDVTYKIDVESHGMGRLVFPLTKSTIGYLVIGKTEEKIYIEPDATLKLAVLMKPIKTKDIEFTQISITEFSGDCKSENEFMRSREVYNYISTKDLTGDMKSDFAKYEDLIAENIKKIDAANLSSDFKRLEQIRQRYSSYESALKKILNKDNRDEFMAYLSSKNIENPSLLPIDEYRSFLKSVVITLSLMDMNGRSGDFVATLNRKAFHAVNNFKDPLIQEYLVDLYVASYIKMNGFADTKNLVDLYYQKVKDPKKIAKFKEACAVFEKLSTGNVCPPFTFKDVNDKTVTLNDFKGKYVYLDIWATWCGPCKAEIPNIKLLEQRYEGRNIIFVGLSIDRNKDIATWKRTVAEMKMGGCQLHFGENWDWLKNFMPYSMAVPRFILIDKDGKIIDANMTPPSNKKSIETIDALINL